MGNLTFNSGVEVEKHLVQDVMKSVKPWLETLIEKYRYRSTHSVVALEKNLLKFNRSRVMIYNGQMDVIIAWPLTESFITSMKWSGAEVYKKQPRKIW